MPLFLADSVKNWQKNKGIYNQVEAADLEKLCGSVHHQGVVAMINAPEIQQIDTDIIEDWVTNKKNAILLDKIGNANNFGAIVRSAAFFGIENIIIPLDESQSSVTTSSYRVAEGGMEYVNIYSVRSISRLLEALKDKMVRVATSLNATKNVSELKSMSKDKPVLIILGNEENGVSETTLQNCDEKIIIPFKSTNIEQKESNVDSLNVAQASSIIFYELTK